MLDDVIKIIDIPTESISCFDDNGLSFIQAYYDKINVKINNNLNNNIKKYFINELKKKRDSLHNNLKNINKIIKELIDFKNFLKVENLLNNSQKKNLTFLNSKSTLFIKDPYIVGECIAHFLFLTIQNKYNLSNDDFYVSNLFNDDNNLTSFTDLNDIIKYFLFYYNIIDSFAAKDSDYSILFNETKRKEVIKKCVFITPYVKTVINPSGQKTTQKTTQQLTKKKKYGGRDEDDNLLSKELKKTVNIAKSSTQKSHTGETASNSNNLLQKLKKIIIEGSNKNLYEVYNKNFGHNMKKCYENYYNPNSRTNKNNIENLFQKDNEEIPIINIISNSYIASFKTFINTQKSKEKRGANTPSNQALSTFTNTLSGKSGGVKTKKGKSGTKNTTYEIIKQTIKNTEIKTIIENIDYYTKFTFLQSMHYLNDEKNKGEINIFLKKLKTNLIDILLLFYINKKEIIKTFLNEFSNRKIVLNKNNNIKNNNIKSNNIVNNNKENNNKENSTKEKNTKKNSNKNIKINTTKIDEQIKLYNLKNTLQIKKVKLLLTKLEEIKNLEGTPDYDKMVIIIEKKIRDILLNKK